MSGSSNSRSFLTGENPGIEGQTTIGVCDWCGGAFVVRSYRAALGHWCSAACRAKAYRGRSRFAYSKGHKARMPDPQQMSLLDHGCDWRG